MMRIFYRPGRLFSKIIYKYPFRSNLIIDSLSPAINKTFEATHSSEISKTLFAPEPFSPFQPSQLPDTETFIYITEKLPTCSYQELLQYSRWFSTKPRFCEKSTELNNKIWESAQRLLESDEIWIPQLLELSKLLLTYPRTFKAFDNIFTSLIVQDQKYLNMEEINSLLILNYHMNCSLNIKMLNEALRVLEQRISQSYSAKKLLMVMETCSQLSSLTEETAPIIAKISSLMQNNIDITDVEDYLKMIEIYNHNEGIHKSFLSISFKFLNSVYSESSYNLSLQYLYKLVQLTADLMRKKSLYVSHFIRTSILNDISTKITLKSLEDEKYGRIFEDILTVNTVVPPNIIQVFLDRFEMAKCVDYSYIMCFYALYHCRKYIDLSQFKKKSILNLKEAPISEVLRVFNSVHNAKVGSATEFILELQRDSLQLLDEIASSEDLSTCLSLLNSIENILLFRKPLFHLYSCVEKCLKSIYSQKSSVSFPILVATLVKFYHFAPDFCKLCLKEISESYPESAVFSALETRGHFPIRGLYSLLATYDASIQDESILHIFPHIHEDCSKVDVVSLSSYINRVSGNLYESSTFELTYNRFFSYLDSNKIHFHFQPFLKRISDYIEKLDDESLLSRKALIVGRYLAMFGVINSALATRLLNLHNQVYIRDHLSFLHLFRYHEDQKAFYKQLQIRVLPEVRVKQFVNSWTGIDIKNSATRVQAYASVINQDPELNARFIEGLTGKIEKWHSLYLEELFYLLENINEGQEVVNDAVLQRIIQAVGGRIIKEELGLGVVNTIRALKAFCRFSFTDPGTFQKLFSDIGRLYLKFSIDQKVEILSALGSRGFSNKEVFKAVFKDLSKKSDGFKEPIIDAMNAVCDVNLDNEPFVTPIYNEFLTIIGNEQKINTENLSTKIGFCLGKLKGGHKHLEKFASKATASKNNLSVTPRKRLIVHYLCKVLNINFGSEAEFEFLSGIVDGYSIWGIRREELEGLKEKLLKKGINSDVFSDIAGIKVPLAIPKYNAAIIPKTPTVTLLDKSGLRGEHTLLVNILKKQGINVYLIENLSETVLQDITNLLTAYPN